LILVTLSKRVVPVLLALVALLCATAPSQSTSSYHSKKHTKKSAAKSKKPSSARVQRTAKAFVASLDLKGMATQLLQNRSKAAYEGVEKYAIAHPNEAGSLAWFVIGYAHLLDEESAQAIPALVRAKEDAEELDDYVTFIWGRLITPRPTGKEQSPFCRTSRSSILTPCIGATQP